jgi:TPR repeat protein
MPLIELRAMAEEGDIIANYYLYLRLRDLEAGSEEAAAALQFAVDAAFPQAQLAFAKNQSDAEARFSWTERASASGYPLARLALGELFVSGHGVQPDSERGLSLVRSAYDHNVPHAEVTLAELYASGIGEPRSEKEAPRKLFLSAARANQAGGMLELHRRYFYGYTVPKDHLEASRWLVNASLHDKQYLDQYLDASGKPLPILFGEPAHFAKTFAVYAQALIQKQPVAMKKVAEWYEHGLFGKKSSVRAYALLSLAKSSGGDAPVEVMGKLKKGLSAQEVKTAESLISQWQQIQPDVL